VGWLLSLALCLAGLAAVIIEFFVPAAGVIGVLGFGSIVSGIVLAYVRYGSGVGAAFLIGAVVATPAVIALYFKLFPTSFVGRWLILKGEQKVDDGFVAYEPKDYGGLVGAEGVALTVLRPSGMAQFDGVKHSVVTAGDYVERGEPVCVAKVQGSRIIVRKGDQ
jgi:membrane-bound serine protease (ClpP class)